MENSKPNNIIAQAYYEELCEHKFFGIIISKAVKVSSEKLKNKILELIKALNTSSINSYNVKKIAFYGLPDDIASMRSLVWKYILNYLSSNVDNWEQTIDNKRLEYVNLRKKIFDAFDLARIKNGGKPRSISDTTETNTSKENTSNSNSNSTENKQPTPTKKKKTPTFDHPLATTKESKWKSYFEDQALLDEIEKDVRRTRTHMHFFFMPSKSSIQSQSVTNEQITKSADKKRNDPGNHDKLFQSDFESNADVMCRILFIYGKQHPEIRYIQGMNEMLAAIFYCFSNDQNPYFYINLEADSYYCFEKLMDEIKDIYIRSKDNTETGIQTRIKNLNKLLKIQDREVYDHFVGYRVEIQYFVFRWYSLFLTQEFEMPDILRLWDSILSEDDKFEFLNMLCLAIIKNKRSEIIESDFSGIMMALQNLDKIDVENLIKTAESIREELIRNNND